MPEIEWEDPAPSKSQSGKYSELAAALRKRPGDWAVFGRGVSTASKANIERGVYSDFRPAGSFEATVRKTSNGKGDVYVRFRGDASSTAASEADRG